MCVCVRGIRRDLKYRWRMAKISTSWHKVCSKWALKRMTRRTDRTHTERSRQSHNCTVYFLFSHSFCTFDRSPVSLNVLNDLDHSPRDTIHHHSHPKHYQHPNHSSAPLEEPHGGGYNC